MRLPLGVLACLLAGCTAQPTVSHPLSSSTPADLRPTAPPLVLRIGVEHLPPDDGAAIDADPRVEAQPRAAAAPPPSRPGPAGEHRQRAAAPHAWTMSAGDLTAIDDPIARETLQFVQDLVEADQRRVREQVCLPFLGMQESDPDAGPILGSEQALLAAQEEWVQQHGPGLLRRPLRQLLKRLPVAEHFELEFEDFRSDNVPLTGPYREVHGDRGSLGRMSVRLHTSDLADPVELAYIRSGIRIGTSQESGKLSIDWDLSATLRLELRARADYATHDEHLRADLAYRHSPTTSLHVSIGDDMDFLSTSSIYSLFETPMDGAPGLVLYAVHIF